MTQINFNHKDRIMKATVAGRIYYLLLGVAEAKVEQAHRQSKSRKNAQQMVKSWMVTQVKLTWNGSYKYGKNASVYNEVVNEMVDEMINKVYGPYISSVQDWMDYQFATLTGCPMF